MAYRRVAIAIAATALSLLAGLLLAGASAGRCLPADCTKYHGKLKLTAVPAAPGYTQIDEDIFKVEFTIAGKIKGVPQRCLGGRSFSIHVANSIITTDFGPSQDKTGKDGTFEEQEQIFLEDPAKHPKSKFAAGGALPYTARLSEKTIYTYGNAHRYKCVAVKAQPVEVPLPQAPFPP
jgi:hypothetical protein